MVAAYTVDYNKMNTRLLFHKPKKNTKTRCLKEGEVEPFKMYELEFA